MECINVYDDILIAIDAIPVVSKLTARERERKAERQMLSALVGNEKLTHDKNGKPLLDSYNISISHTVFKSGGFIAIMLSKRHNVGIDIEYKSERVMKIASRFLRQDEAPESVNDHLVYWCAKEAVYKLFSSEDLTYQEMKVNEEMTKVTDLKAKREVNIFDMINDNYILVYTYC